MTGGRIAARSGLALLAAGAACMIGGLAWAFASGGGNHRQPVADSGFSPVATVALPPSVGPGPGSYSSAAETGSPKTNIPYTGAGAATGTGSDSVAAWAARVSGTTGIPERALQGYGYAEIVLHSETPGCHLGWNTLAGIGMVESDHGRYGGAALTANGTESKPVIGPALDGSPGRRDLPATDHGLLTGDPVHDHAVGPMQILPETWREFADPGASPQNIDAAAIAAGRYLCADGRDLTSASGWWAAIHAYNQSSAYADLVFQYADAYAHDTP
jgi:hypothetical protein